MSTLELVSKKAQELLELEKLVDQKQAELKEVQNKYKKVSEEDIPSMLSELGLSENDSAVKLADELAGQGLDPAQKKWVEPMTLKAFVREQVENGNDLPLETFNVYIGQKTRIIKK